MAMFGMSRRQSPRAGYMGIVETPEQDAERRRLEAMFPNAPRTAGAMERYGAMQPGMGFEPAKKKRSILPYVLAAVEDTAARQMGYQPQGVARLNARADEERFYQQRAAEQQRARAAALADYRTKLGIEQEFAEPEVDPFDRDMIRAGIMPGTPEYNRLARENAERRAMGVDPILQGASVPGGGTYTGPYSRYSEIYGGGQSNAPDTLPADFFDNQGGQKSAAQPLSGSRTIDQNEYNRMLRGFGGDQRLMNIWMRNNNVIAG